MHDTRPLLLATDFPPIFREELEILQVNLGYLCNLSCVHCHVNAGPTRTELMTEETMQSYSALPPRLEAIGLGLEPFSRGQNRLILVGLA